MKNKKILVVSQHFWPENFRINDIVDGFLSDGIEVDVLCGIPNYPKGFWFNGYTYFKPRKEAYHGATVYRAGEIPRKGNTGTTIFLNYISWPFFALFSLFRLSGHYDAVLCYNTSPVLMSFPAIIYAKLHHVPLTNYVLDIWPENLYSVLNIKNEFLRKIATNVSNWHYKRADKLIAMSPSLKKRLMERTKKTEDKISVIPQYCEDFYACKQPDKELESAFKNKFKLVFTGNFSPAQSLETVIEAVCNAKKLDGCQNVVLLLVGDGMSRPSLEALTEKLNAKEYIKFLGSVPPTEIPKYTTLADALILSLSNSEDLGMTIPAKLASYMAAEKPVIASINGEGALAVEAAKCGITSPACDVKSLTNSIFNIVRMTEEQRKAMGLSAKKYYLENYQRSKLLHEIEQFIF